MAKIAPSILSADFYKLGEEIKNAVSLGSDWIHVDVMDGQFVPPITFGSKIVADIKKHDNIFCDVHLMVKNPENQIPQFVDVGANLINFHAEATNHGDRLVQLIKDNMKLAGITINPTTPLNLITHYLPIIDLILIMSVNPGYGGQKMLEYTLEKIKQLKELKEKNNYKFLIEIDGGIHIGNIEKVLKSGTDVIVTGSNFFESNNEDKKKIISLIHNYKT